MATRDLMNSFARLIVVKPPKDGIAAAGKTGSLSSVAVAAQPWQRRIAHFYGDNSTGCNGSVGELKFAVRWIAHQVGRLGWTVKVGGEVLPAKTSAEYVALVADRQATEQITANLVMFGELVYAAYAVGHLPDTDTTAPLYGVEVNTDTTGPIYAGNGDLRWRPISVVTKERKELMEQALTYVTGLNPSPLDPALPDAPIAGVLPILEEIEQLDRLTKAQNRSRLAQVGILGVASELSITSDAVHSGPDVATGMDTDDFAQMLQEAISSPMEDPEHTASTPILLRAPAEMLASGGWARWLQMSHSYDEMLAQRLQKAIQRLAWGLPMPPEILMGMAASNRAVAFQVEEASYREHVEPVAAAVGTVYASALAHMLDLEDDSSVEFIPDPTALLARQHSVEDAVTAWNLGLVSAKWVREVLGIPEEAAPSEEDLALLLATQGRGGEQKILGQREGEPHTKDGSSETPIDGEPTEGSVPSTEPIAASLKAAIQMAYVRAKEKVGAKVRTAVRSDEFATKAIDGIRNVDVAVALGEGVVEAAIDVDQTLYEAIDGLGQWWADQFTEDVPTGQSAATLRNQTVALVKDRLYLPGTHIAVPNEIVEVVLADIQSAA